MATNIITQIGVAVMNELITEVEIKLNSLKETGHICGGAVEFADEYRIRFWVRSRAVPGFLTFFDKYSFWVKDGFQETANKLDKFFIRF